MSINLGIGTYDIDCKVTVTTNKRSENDGNITENHIFWDRKFGSNQNMNESREVTSKNGKKVNNYKLLIIVSNCDLNMASISSVATRKSFKCLQS